MYAELLRGEPSKIVGQTLTKQQMLQQRLQYLQLKYLARDQKLYYKSRIICWDDGDNSNVQGNFIITPNSKVLEKCSVLDASIISVDSTIGFGTDQEQ